MVGRLCAIVLCTQFACSVSTGISQAFRKGEGEARPGPSIATRLQLPREYNFLLGTDWSAGTRFGPFDIDQWRFTGLAGYGWMPRPEDRVGWESGVRLGVARGTFNGLSGVAGLSFALPVRIGDAKQTWQTDSIAAFSVLVVPEIAASRLLAGGMEHPYDLTATISLRFHLWPNLIP
jgi:hypothetical protein